MYTKNGYMPLKLDWMSTDWTSVGAQAPPLNAPVHIAINKSTQVENRDQQIQTLQYCVPDVKLVSTWKMLQVFTCR